VKVARTALGKTHSQLDLGVSRKSSAYEALWNVMTSVELRQVEEAVRQWLKDSLGEAISVDAKSLRESCRELPVPSVVVSAGYLC
jgi:hypothetical protein